MRLGVFTVSESCMCYSLAFDMNPDGIGEGRKVVCLVDGMGLHRQAQLEVFVNPSTRAGILTGTRLFARGNRARFFWKHSREDRLGDVGKEPVGVLVVDPLF